MSPKVLSMYNNAKIFLSPDELRELAMCIEQEIGKPEKKETKKSKQLENWTMESVTEKLLATTFNKNKRKNTSSNS